MYVSTAYVSVCVCSSAFCPFCISHHVHKHVCTCVGDISNISVHYTGPNKTRARCVLFVVACNEYNYCIQILTDIFGRPRS